MSRPVIAEQYHPYTAVKTDADMAGNFPLGQQLHGLCRAHGLRLDLLHFCPALLGGLLACCLLSFACFDLT